jgi:hypothetical protein
MDESVAVIERLKRIDELERAGAEPAEILAELRLLVVEAERWARKEGDAPADTAVAAVRSALARDMIAV